jgi:hypothetical protein
MRNELQVWCEGEWAGNEQGGVAVETARLCCLRAEETLPEPLPIKEDATEEVPIEAEPVPPQPPKRNSQERRHLAGANWLDDWTLYFPPPKKPKPKRLPKK